MFLSIISSFRAFLQNGVSSTNLSLSENFGNMEPLAGQNQIDRFLRGLVKQPTEKVDFNFVEDVSVFFQMIYTN